MAKSKNKKLKAANSITIKKLKSGKTKGCSGNPEQPIQSISGKSPETEKTINDLEEKINHIVLPFRL